MGTTMGAPLERDVQRDVIAVYERMGCWVARTSPGRKGGTFQAPGIPDLYVFPPLDKDHVQVVFSGHAVLVRAPFWHETKAVGGRQSSEQRTWQVNCEGRGVAYVLGGVADAVAHLRKLGLVA